MRLYTKMYGKKGQAQLIIPPIISAILSKPVLILLIVAIPLILIFGIGGFIKLFTLPTISLIGIVLLFFVVWQGATTKRVNLWILGFAGVMIILGFTIDAFSRITLAQVI